MSLEFYCHWRFGVLLSHTSHTKKFLKMILKILGFYCRLVDGVLLSLEFYRQQPAKTTSNVIKQNL
jgi:hypothetical protein